MFEQIILSIISIYLGAISSVFIKYLSDKQANSKMILERVYSPLKYIIDNEQNKEIALNEKAAAPPVPPLIFKENYYLIPSKIRDLFLNSKQNIENYDNLKLSINKQFKKHSISCGLLEETKIQKRINAIRKFITIINKPLIFISFLFFVFSILYFNNQMIIKISQTFLILSIFIYVSCLSAYMLLTSHLRNQ